jgi:3-deoxy-manno-octulosonate cytidylyltransferase (CMP-KDO synthetase)
MASSRFPGKPLVQLLGLALVLHVYERCKLYSGFSDIVVATCDEEIRTAVEEHGGNAVMTADTHERATDRVQEAIEILYPDLDENKIIVMIQGDELLVSPDMIAGIVDTQSSTGSEVVNFGSRLQATDHDDPNTVKLVAAPDGRVLYFSRAPIPSRSLNEAVPMYQQTGIMAFTYGFLCKFSSLPQTPLEIIESVDMLRVLEHGYPIHAVLYEGETLGVDTAEDKKRGEAMLADDPLTGQYILAPSSL